MKKKLAYFLLLIVTISATFLISDTSSISSTVSRTITIEKLHNQPLSLAPLAVIAGDTVYFSSIELKGKWEQIVPPANPWPWQAFQWYSNVNDDNPFAPLNWTGLTLDTTWAVANLNGIGKYTIDKKVQQIYQNGAFNQPNAVGWMATTNAYYIEIYQIDGTTATLSQTLNFNPSAGDTSFKKATYEFNYKAEGRGVYPAAVPAYPDSLINAKAEVKIKFEQGSVNKAFVINSETDSLRLIFKNQNGPFASYTLPVNIITSGQLGLTPSISLASPVPPSGYFNAGDTVLFNITLKSDNGDTIRWWESPSANGIQKMEILVSGPKRDYDYAFRLRNIINNYAFQYDSLSGGFYTGNPIKIKLPAVLPYGNGTYTVFTSAKRIFGSTIEKAAIFDFQVGSTVVDQLPVSSAIAGQSCASCHGLNGPTKHHGSAGAEQCNPCHTDKMSKPFTDLIHVLHQNKPTVVTPLGDCNSCHLNNSQNQFTDDANVVCSSCHGVVPYFPADHAANVPLYAPTGLSCATANCHGGGNLGVFKNITETHAGLAAKYAGTSVTAKLTDIEPNIDGVAEPLWNFADSLSTVGGIKLKFIYDSTDIYVLAQWKDAGYKLYSGTVVPPTRSVERKKWQYNGTSWVTSGDEDRLAFIWEMNDGNGASCARTCHDPGQGHKTSNGKMDNWHWKAQRTNPVNRADDQYWDNAGRKNDAVTAGSFGIDNINGTATLPIYQATTPAGNNAEFLYLSAVTAFVNSGWQTGDVIPGWVINDTSATPIIGSRADVIAKGTFDQASGFWTVEFKRKLNTGNTDDVVFDKISPRKFTIARFDNTGGMHANQGVDASIYTLNFSTTLIPVELVSFKGEVSGKDVILSWQTRTEKNNFGFEVEAKDAGKWQKIGFVKGTGTSASPVNYSFRDTRNTAGTKKFYRLKQIDLDGSYKYYPEIEVQSNIPDNFSLSQNYPNPFNPTTKISFALKEKSLVTLSVFDVTGKLVEKLVNREMDAGYYDIMYNASNLVSGIYFYRIEAGTFVSTKKMILVK